MRDHYMTRKLRKTNFSLISENRNFILLETFIVVDEFFNYRTCCAVYLYYEYLFILIANDKVRLLFCLFVVQRFIEFSQGKY